MFSTLRETVSHHEAQAQGHAEKKKLAFSIQSNTDSLRIRLTSKIKEAHDIFVIFTLCFSSVVTLFHCGPEDLHIVL